MSQHDLIIDNQGFPTFRADLNAALAALGSTQSGTSAPSTTYANQLWFDTTNNILKFRNAANDAWVNLFTIDQINDAIQTLTLASIVITGDGSFTGTGQVKLPVGTTAERSGTPAEGMIRYNSDLDKFEGYSNGAWGTLGGGATGGGADEVFVENTKVVTTNYTLPTGKNASSVGAITINSGVSVTVPSGSRWVVL